MERRLPSVIRETRDVLQAASAHRVELLLEMGLPDRRMSLLPDLVMDLARSGSMRFACRPHELRALESSLAALLPEMRSRTAAMDAQDCPVALDHGDLHPGNILCAPQRSCVCDWDDACITHPFCSLGVVLPRTLATLAPQERRNTLDRLIAAYLAPWTAAGSREVRKSSLRPALWLSHGLRALDCARMFSMGDETAKRQWCPLIAQALKLGLREAQSCAKIVFIAESFFL